MKFLRVFACALAILAPVFAETGDPFGVSMIPTASLLATAASPQTQTTVNVNNYQAKEQPADNGLRFGVTGGLSLPTGDLKTLDGVGTNKSTGFNVGIQVSKELDKHNEIRGSLTYHKFGSSDWNYGFDYYGYNINTAINNKYENLSVGVDWLYHFTSCDEGLYSILGVSANKMTCKWDGAMTATGYGETYDLGSASGSYNHTGIGLKAGLGYAINRNVAIEATYNRVCLDKDKFGFNGADWIGVGVVFKF
jgi:hypothetical protein